MTVYAEGASPIILSVLGGLPTVVLSSKDAQASLEASWAVPSKDERPLEARSRESEVITIKLL